MCHNGLGQWVATSQDRANPKPDRSSNHRLELVGVKPELVVIVHPHGTVKLPGVLYLPPVSVEELSSREDVSHLPSGAWNVEREGGDST